MKIKLFLSALTMVGIMACTGCARKPIPYTYPFPTGSYDEPKRFDVAANVYPRGLDVSENEISKAIEIFPIEEISLPDGGTVSKYDAIGGNEHTPLYFDFAFYRIASPIYRTSFDNPDLIKYDEEGDPRIASKLSDSSNDINNDCIKVVKGSVLENGLVVDEAICCFNDRGELRGNYVVFKGEITLSGYLAYEYHPNHWRYSGNGTLWFMPDTTKADVPTYYTPGISVYWGDYKSENPYLIYLDGDPWQLGNTRSGKYTEFDLETLFGGKSYVPVTVTIKDPILGNQFGGYACDTEDVYFGECISFGEYASGTIVGIKAL